MDVRTSLGLVLALSFAWPAFAQDPGGGRGGQQGRGQGGGFDFRTLVVGAADSSGEGDVSADEWRAFGHGLERDGELDRARLKARIVASTLDRDGDGRASVGELADVLTGLDTDADGALRASELSVRGTRRGLGLGVVLQAADLDQDGEVSAQEIAQLNGEVDAVPEAPLPEGVLMAWVTRVQARSSEDRSAFTPTVMLLSIDGVLDADGDGAATPADLAALFAALDADGNSTVEAAELRPQRAGGQGGAGGSESFRQADDEQRAKPPLVKWQRSLEDALELQKRTGKPLFICVNMDGEAASESCAWFRYRDPEFARLTEGFVPLIVSPDRHTPIDHDDSGRRIPDPRFGRVVESEHIDIEPTLYERYFKGTRVAPRHMGIAADGEVLFDIYLTNDLERIDQALAQHGRPPSEDGTAVERGQAELLDSPDASDRELLELRFADGNWRVRFQLASAALDSNRPTQHPEILRLALRDPPGPVLRQALWTAVREPGLIPPELVGEVFRASAADATLRGALTGAFGRLARLTQDPAAQSRAQRWFLTFDGLGQDSQVVDLERWRAALAAVAGFAPPSLSAEELDPLSEELVELEVSVAAAPDDPALRVRQAEGLMRLARILIASGQDASVALEEAHGAAQVAERAGDSSGWAAGVQCWTSFFQNEMGAAAAHGARALPALAGEAGSALALDVLHAFGQARMRQIYAALPTGESFEPAWIADVRDTYEALLLHPGGTEQQALELLAFLDALDARAEQDDFALRAVARYPLSDKLHNWLRAIVLRDEGAAGLELVYTSLEPPAEGAAMFTWYTALASLVAAERQVGNRDPESALAAYGRCVERMQSSLQAEPSYADSALHYICLARAGEARLHVDAKRWDAAVAALREGLTGRPASATTADGLGNTPAQTAQLVLSGLSTAGLDDQAKALRETLEAAGVELRARRQGE